MTIDRKGWQTGLIPCEGWYIIAPKPALVLAGKHNRELLEAYVDVERETWHTFKADLSLAEVLEAVKAGEGAGEMDGAWDM